MYIRDVLDTILPDTGFNRIVIYRIYRIPDSSKFKHKSLQMKAQLVKPVKYDLSSRSSLYTSFTNLKNRNIIR